MSSPANAGQAKAAARIGAAAVGMLIGLLVGLVAALALLFAGYSTVSLPVATFGTALVGVFAGLVFPSLAWRGSEVIVHFLVGTVGMGERPPTSPLAPAWLKAVAYAGSLSALAAVCWLWWF